MNFFWVNIGDSYKEVERNGFLWAPQYVINSKGAKVISSGWKHVPNLKRGDFIFCNVSGALCYVAVATQDAFLAERPQEKIFSSWEMDGVQVDINLYKFNTPINLSDFKSEFIELFNGRCSPKLFDVNGKCTQNYLISMPVAGGNFLLNKICDLDELLPIDDVIDSPEKLDVVERDALIKARVGQGKYRKDVLELWGGKCPITGVNMKQILIASHIVPWYLSDNREKIDKYNGFPLSPVYDKLFDLGYISFNDDGKMIFSPHLSEETMERLKINKQHNIAGLKEEHLRYLKKHREIYGFL